MRHRRTLLPSREKIRTKYGQWATLLTESLVPPTGREPLRWNTAWSGDGLLTVLQGLWRETQDRTTR
jgi:hypothetical protein